MMKLASIVIILAFSLAARADVYLHNPRGSNNRLSEAGRERDNDNRMFDSQNNERGGYNLGNMAYFEGSRLQVEWTNQHSCMNQNAQCEMILQYMCSSQLRDGSTTSTIPVNNNDCSGGNCNTDYSYGMNEKNEYYKSCTQRSRNKGLFTADQSLRGNSAIYTRQNPNGQRSGYECPEERDFYPYWSPTPWIDIAVLTNNVSMCAFYQAESENVKGRWYCSVPSNYTGLVPINETDCSKISSAEWIQSASHNMPAPECRENQFTRDNHLGNTYWGQTPFYTWTLPSNVKEKLGSNRCVLRIRYNVSTGDYDGWQASNKQVDLSSKMGFNSSNEAQQRGYVFKNNPAVQVFQQLNFKLNLNIKTAQFGRVFQDRSFMFIIQPRPSSIDASKKIINLNVRGKRGNIVQVYPAVEYDFVPNKLELSVNDYVHIQWTGSNTNPNNNDGQGVAGSDRSNIMQLAYRSFSSQTENYYDPLTSYGSYAVNYPTNFSSSAYLGLDQSSLIQLATLTDANNFFINTGDLLDNAAAYFNLGARQTTTPGVYYYMCTRNNNFSNRDQKGMVIVYQDAYDDKLIGKLGGSIELNSKSKIEIPVDALPGLMYVRVGANSLKALRDKKMSSSIANSIKSSGVASEFVEVTMLNMNEYSNDDEIQLNKPIEIVLAMSRSKKIFEEPCVYRINSEFNLMTKISSVMMNDQQIKFETNDYTGTYVVQYEYDYTVLIVCLVVGFLVVLVIASVVIFLVKNPKYVKRFKYQSCKLKRSTNGEI